MELLVLQVATDSLAVSAPVLALPVVTVAKEATVGKEELGAAAGVVGEEEVAAVEEREAPVVRLASSNSEGEHSNSARTVTVRAGTEAPVEQA